MKMVFKCLLVASFMGANIVFCCDQAPQNEAQAYAQPAYKDYELFKVVMQIRELTDKTIDKFQHYGLDQRKGSISGTIQC